MRTQEVLIVVRRGGEFLVVHRSPENDAYWHLIAGGVEEAETFTEAAVRELQEETGLDTPVEPLDVSFTYKTVHVECFITEAPAAWEPKLDWEHDEYRWCSADEAAGLFRWPEPAEIVQDLGTRATTGSPVPRPTCRQATGKTVTSPSQLRADSRTDR